MNGKQLCYPIIKKATRRPLFINSLILYFTYAQLSALHILTECQCGIFHPRFPNPN